MKRKQKRPSARGSRGLWARGGPGEPARGASDQPPAPELPGHGPARGVASATAAAVVALAALPACGGNKLPPVPVPRAADQRALPGWYPEAPWTGKEGSSRIFIEGKIVFEVDKAIIRPESEQVLQKLLRYAMDHPEVTMLRIEGHTDSTASDEYNMELSARRSLAVCDWLVDHGIDHTRLLAVGFGETRPLMTNATAEGRQENRRTEFHVAEINGRLFRNKDPTAGGYVLVVQSAEERRKAQERMARPRHGVPPKPRVPTGDELKELAPLPALRPRESEG